MGSGIVVTAVMDSMGFLIFPGMAALLLVYSAGTDRLADRQS
jgi:Mg/Co/Ni transporter MgtE